MRRYRLFRRGTTYYAHDAKLNKQVSLQTKDHREAERLLIAKNEAEEYPQINLGVAKAHLLAHDPKMIQRTWREGRHGGCLARFQLERPPGGPRGQGEVRRAGVGVGCPQSPGRLALIAAPGLERVRGAEERRCRSWPRFGRLGLAGAERRGSTAIALAW